MAVSDIIPYRLCFSVFLEILKYSVKVTACLFYLDEAYYCLGKIHQYCCCQQKSEEVHFIFSQIFR